MKVVILAGGLGTRLSEETQVKPKPMVEIGEHPILWHIMKIYGEQGFTDFVVCLGYKGYVIKEYFANYFLHNSDVTFDLRGQCMEVHQNTVEPWRVTLVDTGADTQTGGRLKRVAPYVADETFMMTYGDGVADVDLGACCASTRSRAVSPPSPPCSRRAASARCASTTRAAACGTSSEKPEGDGGWMNGGFFVLEPRGPRLHRRATRSSGSGAARALARDGQLSAYRHRGFWQPMDTLRDKRTLEELWESGAAPWKRW